MDYEALRFIWWVLIGVLLIGFVVTDGFDMGVASLLHWLGVRRFRGHVLLSFRQPQAAWEGVSAALMSPSRQTKRK